eukprot:1152106-Pelagomonas_calceolata.AAC.1
MFNFDVLVQTDRLSRTCVPEACLNGLSSCGMKSTFYLNLPMMDQFFNQTISCSPSFYREFIPANMRQLVEKHDT